MNLKTYNSLIAKLECLINDCDNAFEIANITGDYEEYEDLRSQIFDLELTIPKFEPAK